MMWVVLWRQKYETYNKELILRKRGRDMPSRSFMPSCRFEQSRKSHHLRCVHQIRRVEAKQLDDGIGDTFVSVEVE